MSLSQPTRADVTPERLWLNRRQIIAAMGAGSIMGGLPGTAFAQEVREPNSWEEITSYNNFYEFGTGKDDPAENAGAMSTEPWIVEDRRARRATGTIRPWRS